MEYVLRFAHSWALLILIPSVVIIACIHWKWRTGSRYRYALTQTLKDSGATTRHPYRTILFCMRFITLMLLAILIAKPQWVNSHSKITVEGIDIILVLDVSGSMEAPHDDNDERSRLTIAKEEAIQFIDKRQNDAIGLVIFGNDALSRCPLTVDKKIVKDIILETEIGLLNPNGTVLGRAMITAVNRLRYSHSKSKVMILLTDGEPMGDDVSPDLAIEVAKELGIKIYTIGIGGELYTWDIYGRKQRVAGVNAVLLQKIARETGGKYFEAKRADQMRAIYDTIDALEKTKIESPIFTQYHDWFMPILWIVCILMVTEIIASSLVWFSI
jgi:Ca-activated chloride channel family protein